MTPRPSKTLYLCGPMTGMPDFNRGVFKTAAENLTAAGYTVLNPAINDRPEDHPWHAFMRDSITQMLQADALATLYGWQYSRGANLEVKVGRALGMATRSVEQWLTDANLTTLRESGRP